MTRMLKRAWKWFGLATGVLLVIGVAAPYLGGNQYAPRIRAALESGLGRKVEVGSVHFSLFNGPGFSVENVVIHENPAIGIEPIAYVGSLDAVPRLSSLFGGRLEFSSIRLEDATINVTKTGEASEPGRWNFEALLSPSIIRAIPEFHVRSGRINFKFGDTKSVFYLTNTDLDIAPPAGGNAWKVEMTGHPARTDKPARGLGDFVARGRWTPAGAGRLDLDVRLEKSPISEIVELMHGHDAGIHGIVSARMRLAGPLDEVRISGNIDAEDVHRWDQMPPYGSQRWPLRLAGKLNLVAQTIEMESNTAGGETLPLAVRFRCANYLSDPRWAVALNWNQFPAGPMLELARHLGADLPPQLNVTGKLDGVLGYSGQGSLQGELAFHDASMAIPDSPPVRSALARVVFDAGHARLAPSTVNTAQDEQAQVEADYDWKAQTLDLTISTESMRMESLRAQAGLAAIPWLEQLASGTWKGQLHFRVAAGGGAPSGWSGAMDLRDARFPLPGIAEPVEVRSATVHLDGARVTLAPMHAQAGGIAFDGEYRYEPQMTRPHRLRLRIPEADAEKLEQVLMPSLRHSRGLIARALSLGRVSLPEWLAQRHVDASVEFGVLRLGGAVLDDVAGRLLWDGDKVELADIRARLNGGRVTGMLAASLRSGRPVYHLEAHAKGIEWKNGRVEAETVMETSGTGLELLARLHSTGTFAARNVEMEALPDLESVAGSYDVVWAPSGPRWRFTDLQLVSGDETYTGQGVTQQDGRLLVQLTSGSKEMHMSGTLAELRLDQPEARQP